MWISASRCSADCIRELMGRGGFRCDASAGSIYSIGCSRGICVERFSRADAHLLVACRKLENHGLPGSHGSVFIEKETKAAKIYGHLIAIDRTAVCFLCPLAKYPELSREPRIARMSRMGCREDSAVRYAERRRWAGLFSRFRTLRRGTRTSQMFMR